MNGMLIDVSDYDMPTWNPACFRAAGVTGVITNSFTEAKADQRIRDCKAVGLPVIGVYGFVYFGPSQHYVNRDVDAAIRLALRHDIPMVWVDAEADAKGIGVQVREAYPDERIDQLAEAVSKVESAGLRCGIYSAAWWWPGNMAGTTAFSHLPLWHAQYGGKGEDIPPVTRVNYGGWTKVAIHQYTSQKMLCGRGRDHNYLLDANVAAQSVEEEDMTPAEVEEIVARMIYGSKAEYDRLHSPTAVPRIETVPLVVRVNEMERDGGWLDKELKKLKAAGPGGLPDHQHEVQFDGKTGGVL